MKFGVFYELQLPRPWTAESEHTLLKDALDEIELADRLGYDYAWEVEHHFLEEYSHSSAPEVFLGAASQRTSSIRLGHGIVQLTTNHPARVAERVATLDLVSDGRVELGIGEGSSTTELHPFDRAFRDKRSVWEDAVRCLIPMFSNERWEYHGPWFDFPTRNVVPKPYQQPHPPLWVACSQLETIEMAARRGLGALGFQFVVRRRGAGLGEPLLPDVHPGARPARRLPAEPEHRARQRVHVRADGRGGPGQGRGMDVLPVRPPLLRQGGLRGLRAALARRVVEGVPGLAGVAVGAEGRPQQGPHRVARNRCAGACASGRRRTSTRSSC